MLLWVDIESCGLNPQKDALLELAAIVTDDALNEVARYERVVYYPHAAEIVDTLADCAQNFCQGGKFAMPDGTLDYQKIGARRPGDAHDAPLAHLYIDPYVLKMHHRNDLWKACVTGIALDTVDREFSKFIEQHAHKTVARGDGTSVIDKPQLAGSTISFDRGFIAECLPRSLDALHYRNVDVSTLNETARRFWPDIWKARPRTAASAAHRGMADIEESIAVYKYYLGAIGPIIAAPAAIVAGAAS